MWGVVKIASTCLEQTSFPVHLTCAYLFLLALDVSQCPPTNFKDILLLASIENARNTTTALHIPFKTRSPPFALSTASTRRLLDRWTCKRRYCSRQPNGSSMHHWAYLTCGVETHQYIFLIVSIIICGHQVHCHAKSNPFVPLWHIRPLLELSLTCWLGGSMVKDEQSGPRSCLWVKLTSNIVIQHWLLLISATAICHDIQVLLCRCDHSILFWTSDTRRELRPSRLKPHTSTWASVGIETRHRCLFALSKLYIGQHSIRSCNNAFAHKYYQDQISSSLLSKTLVEKDIENLFSIQHPFCVTLGASEELYGGRRASSALRETAQ